MTVEWPEWGVDQVVTPADIIPTEPEKTPEQLQKQAEKKKAEELKLGKQQTVSKASQETSAVAAEASLNKLVEDWDTWNVAEEVSQEIDTDEVVEPETVNDKASTKPVEKKPLTKTELAAQKLADTKASFDERIENLTTLFEWKWTMMWLLWGALSWIMWMIPSWFKKPVLSFFEKMANWPLMNMWASMQKLKEQWNISAFKNINFWDKDVMKHFSPLKQAVSKIDWLDMWTPNVLTALFTWKWDTGLLEKLKHLYIPIQQKLNNKKEEFDIDEFYKFISKPQDMNKKLKENKAI